MMAKKYLLLIVCCASSLFSLAQHCPWDGSSIIMLDIKSNSSVSVQKIYLIDSVGNKVTSKRYSDATVKEDTAEFWKNEPEVAKKNPGRFDKYYYVFAKNNEVLVFGQYIPMMKYSLLVFYRSDNKTMQKTITLSNNDIHGLCTSNKDLWSGEEKPIPLML
jgi:hypothetical protein